MHAVQINIDKHRQTERLVFGFARRMAVWLVAGVLLGGVMFGFRTAKRQAVDYLLL